MTDLPSIEWAFVCDEDCHVCLGSGTVCEDHPDMPWGPLTPGGCECGAAGEPCRGAGSLGAIMARLRSEAESLDAPHVTDKLDRIEQSLVAHRQEILRRHMEEM